MGWKNWQQKAAKELCAALTEPFHLLTTTLLSILLPLSFLLLARLSCYSYLLSIASDPTQPEPSSLLFSFLLRSNPAILYFLVSIFSIATLLHGLTGRFNLLSYDSSSLAAGESQRHRLYTAWILLCTLQVCVGLGIEGSIAAGIDGHSFDIEKSLLSRIIFFLGLHETMLYWSRTVVKPVVDDTVFGFGRDEKWVQRVSLAMSLGSLWWWRLRDEVESLVIVAEAKREMSMGVGMADLLGWWLYYLTVTIGMVRIVKGLMWVMMILLCRRVRRINNSPHPCGIDDKV
ncbi:uncharacterized protein LOC8267337 [Ricinus communis]|uniref:Transmembrane protein n=1 Tax=Ricinus communis TaxID=3988 RepID=B9RND8_RICCO|nr:uncharacterized protein LOC8267337 [Ricinus communis]EEF47261.1 conserved hypothetical protein [Ricinus communis]|eukprot:XP_002515277.1 uncharacterized protein LOC8267337 [Ricinus communis]